MVGGSPVSPRTRGPSRRGAARLLRRAGLLAAAAACCALLGGCIYLRLLELKHQLADFDRYFATDLRVGVKITCLKPVLLDDDMAFFKLAPESRKRLGNVERWHFRWVKAYTAPGEDPAAYDVPADFIFVDHKLASVLLPERLFVFVPKRFFLTVIKAFGHAQVDRARRTASASVQESFAPGSIPPAPSAGDLRAMLGAPESTERTAEGVVWHYRYREASESRHAGRIAFAFTVNPATHKAVRIRGSIIGLTFDVTFPDSTPAPPPDMNSPRHEPAR